MSPGPAPRASRLDVVLVGPPGAGKGTQAALLCERERLRHLSTGNLLRQAVADRTDLGRKVEPLLAAGALVPDELVVGLVEERLVEGAADGGVLLDGFPRTRRQAELLAGLFAAHGLPLPLAIEIAVPEEEVVRRLAGRRTCSSCGPRPAGESACGTCGRGLASRPDDLPDVVLSRLQTYSEQTPPLLGWFEEKGRLRRVDGHGTPEEVAGRIAAITGEARRGNPGE